MSMFQRNMLIKEKWTANNMQIAGGYNDEEVKLKEITPT